MNNKYYDVKVEALVPAIITYRILAEDEENALKLIDKSNPIHVKYELTKKKALVMKVYDAGTVLLRLIKRLSK